MVNPLGAVPDPESIASSASLSQQSPATPPTVASGTATSSSASPSQRSACAGQQNIQVTVAQPTLNSTVQASTGQCGAVNLGVSTTATQLSATATANLPGSVGTATTAASANPPAPSGLLAAGGARKKTSFQITSVKVHDGGTHETSPQQHGQRDEICEDTRGHPADSNGLSGSNGNPLHQQTGEHNGEAVHGDKAAVGGGPVKKHSITDPQAVAEQWSRRFKVVKIPFTEPFKRVRWTCQDFFDPPEGHVAKTEAEKASAHTGQHPTTSPGEGDVPPCEIAPQPGALVNDHSNVQQTKEGGNGAAGAQTEEHQTSHTATTPATIGGSTAGAGGVPGGTVPSGGGAPAGGGTASTAGHTALLAAAAGQTAISVTDPNALANAGVAATDGNYAAGGAGGIDNKIEQAMDLVKSHLMFAVREEVDVLREKITELNERNDQLTQECQLLRSLLTPEQAAHFAQLLQSQSLSGRAGTGRASHPPPASLPAAAGGGVPRTAPSLAAFGVPVSSRTTAVPATPGTPQQSMAAPGKPSHPAIVAMAVATAASSTPGSSLPASLGGSTASAVPGGTTAAAHGGQQTTQSNTANAVSTGVLSQQGGPPSKESSPPGQPAPLGRQ